MTQSFDVIVVGSGPAGYVAAIRAAQLGFKTACVEKNKGKAGKPILGGVCLNVGCIPSKALLEASHHIYDINHGKLSTFGLELKETKFNLKTLMEHKDKVVAQLSGGVGALLAANKVTVLQGEAKVTAADTVSVDGTAYQAKHIILATGSSPIEIPIAKFDHKTIVDSTGALSFDKVPKRLGVIGGGVIGLELGSVWARLGSKVTIFEAMDDFLAMADRQVAKEAFKIFEHKLDIRLGTKVMKAETLSSGEVKVTIQSEGKESQMTFDKLIVAVGRAPNSKGVIDPSLPIVIDKGGRIEVDQYCQTAVKSIYAVGDVVRGPMLAHKGSEEGVMVVERLKGQKTEVNYNNIPNVIYTSPEIAWTGKTEEELKAEKVSYRSGVFPFQASGRAIANNNTEGFAKILVDETTDRILGAHIIGANAGELLATLVLAIEFEASAEDVILTMFAHPTLSEAVHEAALATHKRAIHTVNRK